MKVFSWIETDPFNVDVPDWILDKYGSERNPHNKYNSKYNLCKSEFKPELITEFFEGWDFDNSEGYYSPTKNPINDTYIYVKGDPHEYLYGESFIGDNSSFIRTLDDFINDCQRAGIELKWKENE